MTGTGGTWPPGGVVSLHDRLPDDHALGRRAVHLVAFLHAEGLVEARLVDHRAVGAELARRVRVGFHLHDLLGFAQVWRLKMREAQQIVQIKTDPHSPGQFRANGPMRNQPGFYDAFGVKPGDKMYLAPKDRVIMW